MKGIVIILTGFFMGGTVWAGDLQLMQGEDYFIDMTNLGLAPFVKDENQPYFYAYFKVNDSAHRLKFFDWKTREVLTTSHYNVKQDTLSLQAVRPDGERIDVSVRFTRGIQTAIEALVDVTHSDWGGETHSYRSYLYYEENGRHKRFHESFEYNAAVSFDQIKESVLQDLEKVEKEQSARCLYGAPIAADSYIVRKNKLGKFLYNVAYFIYPCWKNLVDRKTAQDSFFTVTVKANEYPEGFHQYIYQGAELNFDPNHYLRRKARKLYNRL